MTHVLVIGHSDADGHVIAEQTRRNLNLVPNLEVDAIVDPKRTAGHQAWLHLDMFPEIDSADIVFFVDLMFSPMRFGAESEALIAFANARSDKQFLVMDHHPLPFVRLTEAPNIRSVYRPDVFECAVGPRSGMMVLAAICEHQGPLVDDIRQPYHDILARGLKRAAASGSHLGGVPLMNLLRADRWDALYAVGNDDASRHRLVRGRRVGNQADSEALQAALQTAEIVEDGSNVDTATGSQTMPYDVAVERFVRGSGEESHSGRNSPAPTKDLETLVTLLEFAALSLTTTPDTTFSRQQLLEEARKIAGDEFEIDDRDVKIILEKASFLRFRAGKFQLR